jgi:tetratricopeptide (TPR) repeat protein
VLGIIQVGGQAAADRYTYLPSLAVFTLIGVGVSWVLRKDALLKRKSMLGGLVLTYICIFIFLGQLTIKQIKIWHNSEILWSYVINAFPFPRSDPLAHYNLGNAYVNKGELDKAISEYKRALILKPHYAEAHNNLGSVYNIKNRWDEAIKEIEQALTINPHYAMAHNNLGNAYLKKGELDKAISEYKQALAIKPDYAKAYGNIGLVYYNKGMLDEAIFEYKKALVINSNLAEVHYNLSVVYYYKGNYKWAIVHFDKAVELGASINPKLLELLKPYR